MNKNGKTSEDASYDKSNTSNK